MPGWLILGLGFVSVDAIFDGLLVKSGEHVIVLLVRRFQLERKIEDRLDLDDQHPQNNQAEGKLPS